MGIHEIGTLRGVRTSFQRILAVFAWFFTVFSYFGNVFDRFQDVEKRFQSVSMCFELLFLTWEVQGGSARSPNPFPDVSEFVTPSGPFNLLEP